MPKFPVEVMSLVLVMVEEKVAALETFSVERDVVPVTPRVEPRVTAPEKLPVPATSSFADGVAVPMPRLPRT